MESEGYDLQEQFQLHVVIVSTPGSKQVVSSEIARLGGSLVTDIGQPQTLLANLTPTGAASIAHVPGVRHVGPVGMNSRLKRLRVEAGRDGRSPYRYAIRDNEIVRSDQSAEG